MPRAQNGGMRSNPSFFRVRPACVAALSVAALLAACASAPGGGAAGGGSAGAGAAPAAAPGTVAVWAALGTRQCDRQANDEKQAIARLRAKLQAATVVVKGESCGSDGRVRPAACGAADGRIGVFDISAPQLRAAQAAGFAPFEAKAGAERRRCGL